MLRRHAPVRLRKMVHYESDGVFDASVDKLWKYLTSENHEHSYMKNMKVLSQSGNQVTLEADFRNPDNTWYKAKLNQSMNPPTGWEGVFSGGPMDGAKIKHTYTPMGDKTKVELKGDFRAMPGLAESAQLKMIDDFFTISFNEDNANLQKMK
jgi:hypothetical protein